MAEERAATRLAATAMAQVIAPAAQAEICPAIGPAAEQAVSRVIGLAAVRAIARAAQAEIDPAEVSPVQNLQIGATPAQRVVTVRAVPAPEAGKAAAETKLATAPFHHLQKAAVTAHSAAAVVAATAGNLPGPAAAAEGKAWEAAA